MPLTNAEKQQRFKERNQVVLTWDAVDIAEKMMGMADQAKLAKVVTYLKDHLRHPDRTSEERAIAIGRITYDIQPEYYIFGGKKRMRWAALCGERELGSFDSQAAAKAAIQANKAKARR